MPVGPGIPGAGTGGAAWCMSMSPRSVRDAGPAAWWRLTVTPAVLPPGELRLSRTGAEIYRHDEATGRLLGEFTTFARAVAAGDRYLWICGSVGGKTPSRWATPAG